MPTGSDVVAEIQAADELRVGVDDVAEHDGAVAEDAAAVLFLRRVAAQPRDALIAESVDGAIGALIERGLLRRPEVAPEERDAAFRAGNCAVARVDHSAVRSRNQVAASHCSAPSVPLGCKR